MKNGLYQSATKMTNGANEEHTGYYRKGYYTTDQNFTIKQLTEDAKESILLIRPEIHLSVSNQRIVFWLFSYSNVS